MPYFNKLIAVLALVVLVESNVKAQSDHECKYLSVITYLRTNVEINDRIKMFFPGIVKKKEKFIEFNLYDLIGFLGIVGMQKQILEKGFLFDGDSLNAVSFSKKYFFMPIKSEFLTGLKWENNSAKLFLSFSKPVGNYLMVELTDFDPELTGGRKFGNAMQFFFKFSSSGVIEDKLYAGSAYN